MLCFNDVRKFVRVLTLGLGVFATLCVITSRVDAQELMGYWQFEETNADDDAIDSSGNGLDGLYEGDIELDVEGAPGFGSGAQFDGVTTQVLIGAGDETGFGELTEDFTVMAWIYPEQFDHKNRVFGGFPVGGGWGWGTVNDSLEITTYGVKDYDQPVPLELETWVHAAIVLDEDFQAHFYVDGEFVGTQSHGSPGNPIENDFFIGASCCAGEYFDGKLDEVAVFSGELSEEQIQNAMSLGVLNYDGAADPLAALDDDSLLDPTERANYVHDVLNTWIGDSNLDGEFNSGDFVFVFTAGQYEDMTPGNSTWSTGDWNGDHDFDSGDFVAAFTDGGFENGPRAATAAVPEPGTLSLLVLGTLIGGRVLRRRQPRS